MRSQIAPTRSNYPGLCKDKRLLARDCFGLQFLIYSKKLSQFCSVRTQQAYQVLEPGHDSALHHNSSHLCHLCLSIPLTQQGRADAGSLLPPSQMGCGIQTMGLYPHCAVPRGSTGILKPWHQSQLITLCAPPPPSSLPLLPHRLFILPSGPSL